MRYFIVIILIGLSSTIFGQMQKNFLDVHYIEVNGFAEKEYEPDIVYLDIVINEDDFKDRTSLEEKENELVKIVSTHGIDPAVDLRVKNFGSDFQKYFLRGQKVIKSKNYELKITDISKMAPLMYAFEKAHISNVNLNKVDYSKIEEAKLEVKTAAMSNSWSKAKALTTAVNQQIGKAIHIIDNSQTYVPRHNVREEMYMAKSADAAMEGMEFAPLQVQKIKLTANVYVKYLLD